MKKIKDILSFEIFEAVNYGTCESCWLNKTEGISCANVGSNADGLHSDECMYACKVNNGYRFLVKDNGVDLYQGMTVSDCTEVIERVLRLD